MKKVIFVLGPTAVGKTKTGVMIAKLFGGEVISADSVQVYRGLDVGSAKVTQAEMQGVAHHAIDILEPTEEFSVFDFVEYTRKKIDEIMKSANDFKSIPSSNEKDDFDKHESDDVSSNTIENTEEKVE